MTIRSHAAARLVKIISYALSLCALLGASARAYQGIQTHRMRVRDRAEVPIKIIDARVTTYPAGNLDIFLRVQNIGNHAVADFSVLFPDGPRRFRRTIQPGGIAEFEEFNLQTELKRTQYLAERGELDSWPLSVVDVQSDKDPNTANEAESSVQVDLSAVSKPFAGLEVSISSYPAYFPVESQTTFQAAHGLRVLSSVTTNITVHNTSGESLKGIRHKFQEPIGRVSTKVAQGGAHR